MSIACGHHGSEVGFFMSIGLRGELIANVSKSPPPPHNLGFFFFASVNISGESSPQKWTILS